MISHKSNPSEFEAALNNLLANVNKGIECYWNEAGLTYSKPAQVRVETIGSKFLRLCTFSDKGGNFVCDSVYAFVNLQTGDVLKSATFKAPAPKGVRTNITADDVLNHLTPHGTSYLKGGCFDTIQSYIGRAAKV